VTERGTNQQSAIGCNRLLDHAMSDSEWHPPLKFAIAKMQKRLPSGLFSLKNLEEIELKG
jgi:hypothetical protein